MNILWKPEFSTGNTKIDFEHQIFVNLLANLKKSVELNCDKQLLDRQILEIEKYASFHFVSEENLMLQQNYAAYIEHRELHENLLEKLTNAKLKLGTNIERYKTFLEFLYEWFATHTCCEDTKIAKHLIAIQNEGKKFNEISVYDTICSNYQIECNFLLHDVLDKFHAAIFILDPNLNVIFINDLAVHYFEIKKEAILHTNKKELIKKHIKYLFVHPDLFEEEILSTYRPSSLIKKFIAQRLPLPGKSSTILEHSSKPIESGIYKGGRIEFYYDVTKQYNDHKALHRNKNKLSSIISSITDFLFTINHHGEFAKINNSNTANFLLTNNINYNSKIHYSKVFTIDLLPLLKTNIAKVKRKKLPLSFYYNIAYKGKMLWFYIKLSVYNENNKNSILGIAQNITDIKQIEVSLKESEQKLREAQKIAKVGNWELNIANGTLNWSDGIYELFGLNKEQFKPSYVNFLNAIHPDDRELVDKAYSRSLINKQAYEVEHRLKTAYGEIKYVKEKCKTTFNNLGEPLVSYGVIIDITKEKKSEQKIRRAAEIAQIAESISMAGNWQWNNRTKIMSWSDNLCHIHEIEPTDFDGSLAMAKSFLYSKDEPFLRKIVLRSVRNNTSKNIEYRIITKSGKMKTLISSFKIFYDKNGKLMEIIGSARDITNQRKTEQELINSARIIKATYDSSNDIIILIDPNFRLLSYNILANISAKQILNIPLLRGDKILKYTQLLELNNVEANIKKAFDGEIIEKEYKIDLLDDRTIWYNIKLLPVYNENQKRFAVSIIASDISTKKKIEIELIKSKQEAEKANKLKSEFLANMSHEIRTPMNAVIGFSEILSNKLSQNPEYLHLTNGIIDGGNNLMLLINDILDLSKIEAGYLEIKYTPTNLLRLVDEIKNIFDIKLKNKKLDLILYIQDNLPQSLLLDKTRIRQILFNLVGNAIKFTQKGSINLSVCTKGKAITDSKINLYFRISDTGIGIESSELEQIFQPFRQSKNLNAKYGGTGLGLPITKKLVEAMGGKITVESQLNTGSTFKVEIANVVVSSIEQSTATNNVINSYNEIKFMKANILIVDDIPSNREVIKTHLEHMDCQVMLAKNGFEAIEICKNSTPDLVFMDIQMPDINGYETTKLIKSQHPNIPVIALTALVMKEQREKYEHIFDGYLKKPISLKLLTSSLRSFLPIQKPLNKTNNISDETDYVSEFENYKVLNTCSNNFCSDYYNNIIPLVDDLIDIVDTDEVQKLAEQLQIFAEIYDIKLFEKLSNELRNALSEYNLKIMRKLIFELKQIKI